MARTNHLRAFCLSVLVISTQRSCDLLVCLYARRNIYNYKVQSLFFLVSLFYRSDYNATRRVFLVSSRERDQARGFPAGSLKVRENLEVNG